MSAGLLLLWRSMYNRRQFCLIPWDLDRLEAKSEANAGRSGENRAGSYVRAAGIRRRAPGRRLSHRGTLILGLGAC